MCWPLKAATPSSGSATRSWFCRRSRPARAAWSCWLLPLRVQSIKLRRTSPLGGQIQFRDDSLGYLRVSVAVGQVKAVAALASVQSVDVDETLPLPDPRPEPEASAPTQPQAPPGAATPRDNAYLPIGDTGAAQFTAAHPTWDGRGVTIGVVDLGITLDHPSLLTTSTGERKVVDWVTGTDPFTDDDPTWLDMSAQVSGAQFTFSGRTTRRPGPGPIALRCSTSVTRASAAKSAATSTVTAIRPAAAASLRFCGMQARRIWSG